MNSFDSADQWLSSYGFDLPDERIAQRPVEPRHSARLLAVDPPGEGPAPHARHLSVWDLQQQLQPGDLLVVNDTRVLRARLVADELGFVVDVSATRSGVTQGTAALRRNAREALGIMVGRITGFRQLEAWLQ